MPHNHERFVTHHQSRRWAAWDYTRPAAYFVTICTYQRAYLFGHISDGIMRINPFGRVATEEWYRSEALRAEVHLDAFVVMPNHVHGIVVIAPPDAEAPTDPSGYNLFRRPDETTQHAASLQGAERTNVDPKSLGAFVRAYKSAVTRRINQARDTPSGKVWQRGYHDHIIRTEQAWHRIRHYIETNPARWADDTYYAP
jgi:REP element-mobilizing transposase RayT